MAGSETGTADEEEAEMSQETIGHVMTRLLTDEDLRLRFVFDRVHTLSELQARGFELTPPEIDLFLQSNAETWFGHDRGCGDVTH